MYVDVVYVYSTDMYALVTHHSTCVLYCILCTVVLWYWGTASHGPTGVYWVLCTVVLWYCGTVVLCDCIPIAIGCHDVSAAVDAHEPTG